MVFELRNYLLKPGARDEFIRYFKNHFIDSQKTMGASIPAMFTIKDEPDRFFWIRGFDSMRERSQFLPAFYNGDVWKKFGPAANDMMLEWHNVHLVKPLSRKNNVFTQKDGIFVFDFYRSADKELEALAHLASKNLVPFYGPENTMLWTSERMKNDFPRLPVYQHEDILIVTTHYKNAAEYQSMLNDLTTAHKELMAAVAQNVKEKSSSTLYPV